jgi:hypothetical protein
MSPAERKGGDDPADQVIERGPMSFCQELIYLNSRLDPRFKPVIAEMVALEGELDPRRIDRALVSLTAQRGSLSSAYVMRDGIPCVELLRHPPGVLHNESLGAASSKEGIVAAIAAGIQNLEPESGRVACSLLVEQESGRWLWMLAIHHLASDGWSQHAYGRTFSEFLRRDSTGSGGDVGYSAAASIAYARRQREWFASDAAAAQLQWWIRQVEHLPVQPPPLRLLEAPAAPLIFTRLESRVASDIHAAIHRITRRLRVPLLAVQFAMFARAVARRTGWEQVNILSLVGGRMLPGAEQATGAFYNSVLLSVDMTAGDDLPLLRAATASLFDGLKRQEVPLGLVSRACEERGLGTVAERAGINFNLVRHPLAEFRIDGCRMLDLDPESLEPIEVEPNVIRAFQRAPAPLDSPLTVLVCDCAREFRISFDFCSSLIDLADASALLTDFGAELFALARRLDDEPSPSDADPQGLIYDFRRSC